jgi:SAM-dependent methyltransferase
LRSIDRAQELGEVFTPKREVDAMLDLIPDMFETIGKTFLEPACGDGNFLVEILARKLTLVKATNSTRTSRDVEFEILTALSSIYGVDISKVNVDEARERMVEIALAVHAFLDLDPSQAFNDAAKTISATNIVLGDALTGAEGIIFIEYSAEPGYRFKRSPFHLEAPEMDLFYVPPHNLETIPYWEITE